MNFHTSLLFKQSSILKVKDKICLETILFVIKSVHDLIPLIHASDQYNNDTSSSKKGNLLIESSFLT